MKIRPMLLGMVLCASVYITATLYGQTPNQEPKGDRLGLVCGTFDASGKLVDAPCTPSQEIPYAADNVCWWVEDGKLKSGPCPPSLESRVEKLEKEVAKLKARYQSYYQPLSSTIYIQNPWTRKMGALTISEANALLVALANAINEAHAKRAAEEWSREHPVK